MPPEPPAANPPRRVLAVCADDFGLSPAVSRGILALARRGRLAAVSCLTTGGDWRSGATGLADLPPTVERGLHFDLTEGKPLSAELRGAWPRPPGLPALIAAAHLGRLPLAALAAEWQAQWQAFVDATGAAPQFVDGHQHVHHLPGVRQVVLAGTPRSVAVRSTGCVRGPGNRLKRLLIEGTGGRALQQRLREQGRPHNAVLLGVYGFQATTDYRRRMQGWLAAAPAQGGLLFCHPADSDGRGPDAHDPIAAARRHEAAYLGSTAFVDDLDAAGVMLGPAWSQRPSAG